VATIYRNHAVSTPSFGTALIYYTAIYWVCSVTMDIVYHF